MVMVGLEDLKADADALFGGKAVGLARLLAAGAHVPPGFAVPAGVAPPRDWSGAEREEFRTRCELLLRHGPVAVRSSAIGEDAPDCSFAGMFETVLDVTDVEQAFTATAQCIASAHNARVSSYHGGDRARPVGIVVQAQVKARAAGVCFTVDPLGKDTAIVIEAVAGMGDQLVSGGTAPQRWRVYRSGLGTWEILREGKDEPAPVLTDGEVTTVAEQAKRWERHIGHTLDLEWAFDANDALWWLQARPVTAAKPPPHYHVDRAFAGVDDGPVTVWFNWNVRETLPDPLMPLTWSIWRDVIVPKIMSDQFGTPPSSPSFRHLLCLDLVQGRVYFNMNGILAWPVVGSLMSGSLMRMVDPQNADALRALRSAGVLRARRLPGSRMRLTLDALWAGLVNGLRFAGAVRPRRAMQRLRDLGVAIQNRAAERPLGALGDRDLLEEMRLIALPAAQPLLGALHWEVVAIFVYQTAARLFRAHPEAAAFLAVGIPDNPTTQIAVELDRLTEEARPLAALFAAAGSAEQLLERLHAEPAAGEWLDRLAQFLRAFGQRAPREFDLGAPRWAENPGMILELVRIGVTGPASESVSDRMTRLAAERRRAIEDALSASPRWRRPLLRSAARLVELYMPLREAPKHFAMFVFQRMRGAALELGGRLASRRLIDSPEDVFFLEIAEIRRLVDDGTEPSRLRALIEERKERFSHFLTERPPDSYRSDQVPVAGPIAGAAETADGTLRGTGISTGIASGPVCILTEPDPRAMSDGDVIVVEFADPGWTPLFPRAAAIVMEVGGLMCHAAVVAREMGIPAVFGVGDATRTLRAGQIVTVDGDAGVVRVESSQ